MEPKPRNDREDPVTKLCLEVEDFRRADAGRVKDAKAFVARFFPFDAEKATDRIFLHLPREVRAPIVSGWGIRGAKAALRDDDARIRDVVHDALLAGDVDEAAFEQGLSAATVIGWVPLTEWWAFWRSGNMSNAVVQSVLRTAKGLGLFDERWLLDNLEGRGGKLRGTDTICDTLSKDQIVAWLAKLHASGDGSPAGLVAALGWDVLLAKTSQEALLFVLDALATKIGLVPAEAGAGAVRGSEVPGIAIPDFPVEEVGTASSSVDVSANEPPASEPSWPDLAAPGDMGYAIATGDSTAPGPRADDDD